MIPASHETDKFVHQDASRFKSVDEQDRGSTESEGSTEEEDDEVLGFEEDYNDLDDEEKLMQREIMRNFIDR